eukprot:6389196-Prymnesium_polylepis.1
MERTSGCERRRGRHAGQSGFARAAKRNRAWRRNGGARAAIANGTGLGGACEKAAIRTATEVHGLHVQRRPPSRLPAKAVQPGRGFESRRRSTAHRPRARGQSTGRLECSPHRPPPTRRARAASARRTKHRQVSAAP